MTEYINPFYRDYFFKSSPLFVKGILKKTNAQFYKDIKVGDFIEMELKIRDKEYSILVTVRNLTQGTDCKTSQGDISKRLGYFDLEGESIRNRG